MSPTIQPLYDGPLDLIGDVHGELDALRGLLAHLGYRHDGREHPGGRRLVFLGDLCDRGPDSPGVVSLVAELVARKVAQCVLGNHELNALRGDLKDGNAWLLAPDHPENTSRFACAVATPAARVACEGFFRSLPLALARPDLRVVHAAWDADAIARLGASELDALEADALHEDEADRALSHLLPLREAALAPHQHGLTDRSYPMPPLPDVGRHDALKQTLNPVRRLTSGLEREAVRPFFASHKWRFSQRVRWWHDYDDATAVVFGHYWRIASPQGDGSGEPDLFDACHPGAWLGPRETAFCVDFSVGRRFEERLAAQPSAPPRSRLAALSWPERVVTFDDGTRCDPR
jgi:hypothetical protein